MNPPATIVVAVPPFTMERVIDYGAVTNDMNPLHVDPEFAAATPFGRPIVHGLFVLAPVWDAFERTFGAAAVADGEADIRFVAPTFVGTTPAYAITLTSNENGDAQYAIEVADADGKVAITGTMTIATG